MADNPETNTNTDESVADALRSDKAQLNPEMADALTRLYWQRRLEYQLGYYRKKVRDFEDNVDNAFRLGAILMTVASLLAALGVIVQDNASLSSLLALATAMIPAFASYITAFRQLYNWDRQLTIYRDTQLSLEGAKLLMPDLEALTPEEAHSLFPQLVQQVEGVIEKEAAQWGQIAVGKEEDKAQAAAEFAENYAAALTDSTGEVDQEKLGALSNILEAATGTPAPGQYNVRPDDLETHSPLLPDNFYGDEGEESDEAQQRRELAMAAAQSSPQQVYDIEEVSPSLPPSSEPSVSSELSEDMQLLVGKSEPAASPELDPELQALVGDAPVASPALDPELQALVGDASVSIPELDPDLQALVGNAPAASPALDPELQALVGDAPVSIPELDPDLQALVGNVPVSTPTLDPDLQALVGSDDLDIPFIGDDGSVG